jgi:hypothetical protein
MDSHPYPILQGRVEGMRNNGTAVAQVKPFWDILYDRGAEG